MVVSRDRITLVILGMQTVRSKITSQGQVSVPAEIRKMLGVGPGSILEWEEDGDHVRVRRAGTFSSEDVHQAFFPKPPKRRTLAELTEALRRHALEVHARR
jgi:AbrB family looped-hinge helix DNA binding protein